MHSISVKYFVHHLGLSWTFPDSALEMYLPLAIIDWAKKELRISVLSAAHDLVDCFLNSIHLYCQ